MNYISVCSGIEAATVAWHNLGWKPLGFSEIEKFPSEVLKHHYPDVPNLGDMTKFKDWKFNESIDLLVGGTPCQSFSVAGLRKGLDDPRGNLMLTYLAIAARNKPKWLVWENVPGVLSSNRGLDFASLLRGMGELGYGFAYRILDAQYVRTHEYPRAVAQRRRRVFVVGCLGDWRSAAAVLFERDSLCGNPPPSRETRKRTSGYAESSFGGYREENIGATLKASGGVLSGGSETFVLANNEKVAGTLLAGAGEHGVNGNQEIFSGAYHLVNKKYFFEPSTPDGCLRLFDDVSPTLMAGNTNLSVAYPIQNQTTQSTEEINTRNNDGNGLGIGEDGEPMNTLTNADKHIAAYNITTCDANGIRKDRPNGGMYVNQTNVSNTITQAGVNTFTISTTQEQQISVLGKQHPNVAIDTDGEKNDPIFTLTAADRHAVAFNWQNSARRGMKIDEISPTLDASKTPAIAFGMDLSQKAEGIGMKEELANTICGLSHAGHGNHVLCIGGGQVNAAIGEEISPTLTSAMGTGGGHIPIITNSNYTFPQDMNFSPSFEPNISNTLLRKGNMSVNIGMAVRRLTPIECERLQGFPDDYTNIKENCPDGPRYKALGNSMAVPVMQWIGQRIQQVENLKKELT
jgi:DNA-cytosine methyltransferase